MSESPNTAVAVVTEEERQRMREEKERNAMIGQAIPFALSGGLAPSSFEQVKLVASMISTSGYFADARDVAKAMVKIQYGAELGIPIMSALNNIHIIEGKPSLSAALVGARVMSSGLARYAVKVWDEKGCVLDWFRKFDGKWEPVGSSAWTIDDSKNAGLLRERSNHQRFPKAMCFARAMTSGARAYCPDLFFGAVYDADELRDEVEVREVREAEPKTGAERLTAAVEKAKAGAVKSPDSSGSAIVDVLEGPEAKAARRKAKANAGEPATSPADAPPAPQPSVSPTPSVSAPPSGEAATPSASSPPSTQERGPSTATETSPTSGSQGGGSSPDPTPAPTPGASASTPTPSTSTAAQEPSPSSSVETAPQPSPASSPTSTPTDDGDESDNALAELDAMAPKGDRLLDAIVTIPSDSKKAAAHLKEKRDGMSPAEVELFRCTLKARVTMLLNAGADGAAMAAKVRQAPAEELELARKGAALAAGVGLVWARELVAILN